MQIEEETQVSLVLKLEMILLEFNLLEIQKYKDIAIKEEQEETMLRI